MINDERIPDPEPSGTLVPAPHASTALATPAPLLAPRWGDDDVIAARELFARVVRSTFDALDNVGDSIATAIGLR
jgi:hypothetical protein